MKKRVPAVEGWFEMNPDAPHLLGTRCRKCATVFFPKETWFCRNPACDGTEFEETPLSRTGTLWSFTSNCYAPPAPYVSPDPFVPYLVAAVELAAEKMVVLGQVVTGVDISRLRAGMPMELVLDTLYEDDDNQYVVWKWRPLAAAGARP
jgi:uncharacterized OB-fold protein